MVSGKNQYKSSGVDIDGASKLVDWLQGASSEPHRYRWSDPLFLKNGFAGGFRIPHLQEMEDPIFFNCTDGVGSKLQLALKTKKTQFIGQDLVAMCANDLFCHGARPVSFLDYYACGQIEPTVFKSILASIQDALAILECPLLGGETAELPLTYRKDDLDLAGFMTGVVSSAKVFAPDRVEVGDQIIGLASSGFHSNGYTLLNRWNEEFHFPAEILEYLLQPTALYHPVLDLAESIPGSVRAGAHITGGGLIENLARVVQSDQSAALYSAKIKVPELMQKVFNFVDQEARDFVHVFNLGTGFCIVAEPKSVDQVCDYLKAFSPTVIGEIRPRAKEACFVDEG